jgi:hypothetical protein
MMIHVAFFTQTTPVDWKSASMCLGFVRRGGRERREEEERREERREDEGGTRRSCNSR